MPLTPPDLDTRTFRDLVDEARARIPRYTPDWTNLNDSDPGMALVQLNAWLTETVLYELNRVPELTYTKFLELLNVRPRPAQAARTELTFKLAKLDRPTDPLRVLVPEGTRAAINDPDLPQEVLFETDRRLEAVDAAVAAVIVPVDTETAQTAALITEWDDKTATATWTNAAPFALGEQSAAYVGLLLRPHIKGDLDDFSQDVFPAGLLDLFFRLAPREEAAVTECLFPWEVEARAASLVWEVYTGAEAAVHFAPLDSAGWTELPVSDETAGLQRRGHLTLQIPAHTSRLAFADLTRAFWQTLGLSKPPETEAEFFADLANSDLDLYGALTTSEDGEAVLEAMGLPSAERTDLLSCCASGVEAAGHLRGLLGPETDPSRIVLNPSAYPAADWVALEAGYDAPAVPAHKGEPRPMIWLRARAAQTGPGTFHATGTIAGIALNTVPATQGETRLDERLGASNGRPDQRFALAKAPLLVPDPATGLPDLEIEIGGERWEPVPDFFATDGASQVYTVAPETGEIAIGSGRRGQIPVAGAQVRAVRYRWGGGEIGNAAAGTITRIRGSVRHVDGVTNLVPAENGRDAELREDTLLRAPHDLRIRDRAVSAEDFSTLAAQTPGVPVHRAYALARRRPQGDGYAEQDGAVTVVVLPKNGGDRPAPSEAQRAAICAYLEPRRLITTELYVQGPKYAEIAGITAHLRAERDAKLTELELAACESLLAWFEPITGGDDGAGWPFGQPISNGALYARLLGLPGVRRVENLSLTLAEPLGGDGPADVTPLPEGHLPYVAASSIRVTASHG